MSYLDGPPVHKPVFAFVVGHNRPEGVPAGARYARRHPDGALMVADGPDDTPEACTARWEAAKAKTTNKRASAKKAGKAKKES